jgi:hypothetical protein
MRPKIKAPPPVQIRRSDGTRERRWEVEEILDSKVVKQRGRIAAGKEREYFEWTMGIDDAWRYICRSVYPPKTHDLLESPPGD